MTDEDGWTGKPGYRTRKLKCAGDGCTAIFVQTEYGALCCMIMQHKPVCSYKCNVSCGQVKEEKKPDGC